MTADNESYLLAGQPSELARLQIQSRVWESAARALLATLPARDGFSAVDVGCGVMGWLRVLSEWVGVNGRVVGSDLDDKTLAHANAFVTSESLRNVSLVKDDLFSTKLPRHSFDLVHSRFQIAPLGRAEEQLTIYRELARPHGWIVLEDPDIASWRVNPHAPAVQELLSLIVQGFRAGGGDFNSGRSLPTPTGGNRLTSDDLRPHRCINERTSVFPTAVAIRRVAAPASRGDRRREFPCRPSSRRRYRADPSRSVGHDLHADPGHSGCARVGEVSGESTLH